MKSSPLQLEPIEYVVVDVRAHPHLGTEAREAVLPVSHSCHITFANSGNHFALMEISQNSKDFKYSFELKAFTVVRLDTDACKSTYQGSFNPLVVALNVGSIMYSSMREMLAIVTSRGPHGTASLPSTVLEIGDVEIEFADGKRDEILKRHFCFSEDKLSDWRNALEGNGNHPPELKRPKAKKKVAGKKKVPKKG